MKAPTSTGSNESVVGLQNQRTQVRSSEAQRKVPEVLNEVLHDAAGGEAHVARRRDRVDPVGREGLLLLVVGLGDRAAVAVAGRGAAFEVVDWDGRDEGVGSQLLGATERGLDRRRRVGRLRSATNHPVEGLKTRQW